MEEFNNKSRTKTKKQNKKRNTFENVDALYEGRELTLNDFKSGIVSFKKTEGKTSKYQGPKNASKITNNTCTSKSG